MNFPFKFSYFSKKNNSCFSLFVHYFGIFLQFFVHLNLFVVWQTCFLNICLFFVHMNVFLL
jgi:hypothetical protein